MRPEKEFEPAPGSYRLYGERPFGVAVLHGGPGAPGTMAPVARKLSPDRGVIEPLQSARSVDGQIEELREVLAAHADLPVQMIGSSWGAMLGLLYTARHPRTVRKLILVGCGALEESYAESINRIRMERLDKATRMEVRSLFRELDRPETVDRDRAFARLGEIFTRADAFDPVTLNTEAIVCEYDTFLSVWEEAHRMRIDGVFPDAAKRITCPVVAIHGESDPHLSAGIRDPLSVLGIDFRFVLLERCGHLPWIERYARDRFFRILHEELQ